MNIEPITGRYVTITVEGAPRRLYFEEAGQGRAVVCLHTAGADTRQWRHLMNDAEITANNRLIAFDMPWHGKSLPPEGFETQEYMLTTEAYMETILALIDALELDRPVLSGCSMGGRIALQLAALRPEKWWRDGGRTCLCQYLTSRAKGRA
jgi:pimeloyl-ACP methyl ester carboxylesterase